MAASVGLNRFDGRVLTDWDHVAQSIAVILTTRIGERVMRREFGSEVPALIDRPMTDANILTIYAATANALRRWEPRFLLRRCEISAADETGSLSLIVVGDYRPRGHLGDYSVAKSVTETVTIS